MTRFYRRDEPGFLVRVGSRYGRRTLFRPLTLALPGPIVSLVSLGVVTDTDQKLEQHVSWLRISAMSIRTRFAPSPTGYLHIGGVRTALFNWLLARHHGGQFVLRIDDTDQQRHVESAVEKILDGFRWIGIDWDEGPEVGGPKGPYFQSQRADRYRVAAERLVGSGHVYRDYSTDAERAADKTAAERDKRAYRFRRKELSDAEAARLESEGRPYALRFQVPPGRTLVLHDLIKGDVQFSTDEIGDFVIVRPDGSPLYNFASTVDDVEMEITHVVRADEHLSNTFPQLLVFEALGDKLPQFAHVPYRR